MLWEREDASNNVRADLIVNLAAKNLCSRIGQRTMNGRVRAGEMIQGGGEENPSAISAIGSIFLLASLIGSSRIILL